MSHVCVCSCTRIFDLIRCCGFVGRIDFILGAGQFQWAISEWGNAPMAHTIYWEDKTAEAFIFQAIMGESKP
eukprot:m.114730 g.114730  ORF g.114730 m.114730 type:complete len:72 (+) comp13549_c0_seq3:2949-3164(+)